MTTENNNTPTALDNVASGDPARSYCAVCDMDVAGNCGAEECRAAPTAALAAERAPAQPATARNLTDAQRHSLLLAVATLDALSIAGSEPLCELLAAQPTAPQAAPDERNDTDSPLPYDIVVGKNTYKRGQSLDTLVAAMRVLHGIAFPADDHPDDLAVDRFAVAMKVKMAKSRAKGRGGWDDSAICPVERLQVMLRAHVAKGDPVDVGNFAMMLFNRGARTCDADLPPSAEYMAEARRLAASRNLPPPELTWLYTHCKAIGMTCKSESGKWEHDIALFTINLTDAIAASSRTTGSAGVVVTCQIYGHVVGHCGECNTGADADVAETNKILADNYLKLTCAAPTPVDSAQVASIAKDHEFLRLLIAQECASQACSDDGSDASRDAANVAWDAFINYLDNRATTTESTAAPADLRALTLDLASKAGFGTAGGFIMSPRDNGHITAEVEELVRIATNRAAEGEARESSPTAADAGGLLEPIGPLSNWTLHRLYDLACRQKHEIMESGKCIKRYQKLVDELRPAASGGAGGRIDSDKQTSAQKGGEA